MSKEHFERSYGYKLVFYIVVLFLPLALMTGVAAMAPDSILSPLSEDKSRFAAFIVYFLPGLVIARTVTDSWRKTLGVGLSYIILSPAYLLYAVNYACLFTNSCVRV